MKKHVTLNAEDKLCSIKISNHVAHLLVYRPEFEDHVWSNHIKCCNYSMFRIIANLFE